MRPAGYLSPVSPADDLIAATPEPPYTAVIFRSVRADDTDGYVEVAAEMERLAAQQPGYLGIESSADRRTGLTVSYWASDHDARAWKAVGAHVVAQRLGAERWYANYVVRVATVHRDYRLNVDNPSVQPARIPTKESPHGT